MAEGFDWHKGQDIVWPITRTGCAMWKQYDTPTTTRKQTIGIGEKKTKLKAPQAAGVTSIGLIYLIIAEVFRSATKLFEHEHTGPISTIYYVNNTHDIQYQKKEKEKKKHVDVTLAILHCYCVSVPRICRHVLQI